MMTIGERKVRRRWSQEKRNQERARRSVLLGERDYFFFDILLFFLTKTKVTATREIGYYPY